MSATLAHLAAALLLALTRGPRQAVLRYRIWELTAWMRDCELDGLAGSLHLQRCQAELDDLRVQLALLEPRRACAHTTTPSTRSPA